MFSSKKRSRDDTNEVQAEDIPSGKRARATTVASADSDRWNDSVLNTPTRENAQSKYDSDNDEASSMLSEPGSPQDASMQSGDDDMNLDFAHSPEYNSTSQPKPSRTSPWGQRLNMTNRVPTPAVPMRPGASPERIRTGINHHIRSRHPQQNFPSSDLLEVPSPIDEDEVPTPPSAAEVAGSQLSMLSVSDMDMDEDGSLPRISIDPVRSSSRNTNKLDSAFDLEPMDDAPDRIIVRKQRQRSGALSSGDSPVRAGPSDMGIGPKRGLVMGFRADCEKCRMKVPGHMNHFIN
ncbi:uncharacterized protein MYCFIDRAFT_191606 [Pseudocercospora fijiensis CIRAD86]|uniref:Uncharacterized protein n=1 Tax=Pseudocercospora fijiensis (strain CIRAD86) TaxID=383855 RepID=M3AI63_PSEFD|nr:uncharacterized protein MYCFIDRAFT_191606 [Pseudocercospora fijiensis CIRAD86]EME76898.1 hypothetical protein MYCFIDRAFT_191606 [Pseudocercospora fijiensis CIRAD86]